MKAFTGILLSTISTAALTVALGGPAFARPPVTSEPAPVTRLGAIREAYLASLPSAPPAATGDEGRSDIAQFSNFSNWRNG